MNKDVLARLERIKDDMCKQAHLGASESVVMQWAIRLGDAIIKLLQEDMSQEVGSGLLWPAVVCVHCEVCGSLLEAEQTEVRKVVVSPCSKCMGDHLQEGIAEGLLRRAPVKVWVHWTPTATTPQVFASEEAIEHHDDLGGHEPGGGWAEEVEVIRMRLNVTGTSKSADFPKPDSK